MYSVAHPRRDLSKLHTLSYLSMSPPCLLLSPFRLSLSPHLFLRPRSLSVVSCMVFYLATFEALEAPNVIVDPIFHFF